MVIEVLVVDDQASVCRLLELVVTEDCRFGTVQSARAAAPALEMAGRTQPDVIVLDADLDGVDGLRLIPQLRAASPVSAIAVYSSAPYATTSSARKAGADVFVEKGTDLDVLLDELAALCPLV